MNKKYIIPLAIILTIALGTIGWNIVERSNPSNTRVSTIPTLDATADQIEAITTIATNLSTPWEVAVLPGGDLLVTERTGTIKRIGQNNQTYAVSGVESIGEGGLLGLVLDPDFESNDQLYVYHTTQTDKGLTNRIVRYELQNDALENPQSIIEDIPGASFHDGGRIAFGPDGYLYVATGDAGNEPLAQDTDSLAGKILRLTADGSIPANNPFDNYTYSYGHRNPQGLAWDSQDRLWISEHGPSGPSSGFDEVNLIVAGGNYGWPIVTGDETDEGFILPVIQSGADDTWAPADIAIDASDNLYFSGLRGKALYKATIEGDGLRNLERLYSEEYGRLRATTITDNILYMTTSNTDGRGDPTVDDDLLLSIPLID